MSKHLRNLGISEKTLVKVIRENPGISITELNNNVWDKYSIYSKGYMLSTSKEYIARAVRELESKNKIKVVRGYKSTLYPINNGVLSVIKSMLKFG